MRRGACRIECYYLFVALLDDDDEGRLQAAGRPVSGFGHAWLCLSSAALGWQ